MKVKRKRGESMVQDITQLRYFLPYIKTIGITIAILIVGWIMGRIFGKAGSKVLDKIGLDDVLEGTAIDSVVKNAGMTLVSFFDTMIRWFIYVLAILAAVNNLKWEVLSNFIAQIPNFLVKVAIVMFILVIGVAVAKFLGKVLSTFLDSIGVDDALKGSIVGKAIENTGMSIVSFFDFATRLFVYAVTFMLIVDFLELEGMKLFMVNVLGYLPTFFFGIVILIVGFLVVDFVADYVTRTGEEANVAFVRLFSGILRFFLYYIVLIIALQTIKVDVEVLLVFAKALAWGLALGLGLAIGIGFGYGIKDKAPQIVEELIGKVSSKEEK
ncbi:MAG: hypothetical protein ACE5HW_04395 [Candidatus Methanofastidiosia archaeon]